MHIVVWCPHSAGNDVLLQPDITRMEMGHAKAQAGFCMLNPAKFIDFRGTCSAGKKRDSMSAGLW